MTERAHEYAARLTWEGNLGEGTARYAAYGRDYRVGIVGKPDLAGSADPLFRGRADRLNPEDLFLSALAACHMLSYLALCARGGVRVLAYEDDARGRLVLREDGGGRFESITLHPVVEVASPDQVELATRLHDRAHELCFLANSCSVTIQVVARVDCA